MGCPLCKHQDSRESWIGSIKYDGKVFEYRECAGCGALFCEPMPSPEMLKKMYSSEYAELFHTAEKMGGDRGVQAPAGSNRDASLPRRVVGQSIFFCGRKRD
ncbi:MAG TPA: hypothetical protein VN696_05490 [Pyrinomonadaceae bacterium]|nr:hypothetical protein [Pyrinomonadaceae bacterium]